MTISALVVTLSRVRSEQTLALLASDPRLELGERFDDRVPVVCETSDCRAGYELVQALRDIPGVDKVDVVMVDFSQETA